MGPLAAAAAISGGTNLVSNLFNIGQAKKERKFQREMAEYSYQKDVDMWNMQNEYNTPAKQRERMEAANMNPALMYKGAPQNTAQAMPKYQKYETPTAPMQLPNVLDTLSQFMDIKIKKGQEEAIKEDVETKRTNNAYLDNSLMYNIQNSRYKAFKNKVDLGITNHFKSSPYYMKQSGDIKRLQLDNSLKNINIDFIKTIPKEMQWLAPLLMKLIQ